MISVVIPTRNRAALLQNALDSLTRQTVSDDVFEVIVVDNGSTDGTADTVRGFTTRLPGLRCVHESEPGLHAGRHRGVHEAQGEVLVFADDDIEALPSWLSAIEEAFTDTEVVLVGGNNLPLFVNEPPAWLRRLWQRPGSIGGRALAALSLLELPGPVRSISPFYVWGCNFSVRRSTLLAAGGFHPDSMPRERIRFRGDGETHVSEYVVRSRGRCLFHPAASVYHKVVPGRMTFDYFHERGFNQGVSDSFAALRRRHVKGSIQNITSTAPLSQRLVRFGRRKVWDFLSSTADTRHALRQLATGYRKGYAFHQHAFASDSEVRAWVVKPNYLEVSLHVREN